MRGFKPIFETNKAEHWAQLYPTEKIAKVMKEIGFKLRAFDESLMIIEPMDVHGNVVLWKCLAVAATA